MLSNDKCRNMSFRNSKVQSNEESVIVDSKLPF